MVDLIIVVVDLVVMVVMVVDLVIVVLAVVDPKASPLSISLMVQSLGLGRRDGSVSATRIGLGRYAQNAT